MQIKELVEYTVKALVESPEQVEVEVEEVEGRSQTYLKLRVAQEDRGKVIGKNGRIAKSIKHVVEVASIALNTRARLEIE